MTESFTLTNDTLRLEFARNTGALTGITAVKTKWRILDRPSCGLSFRLYVPTRPQNDWHSPGVRNNCVNGERHPVTTLEVAEDRRSATMVWDGVSSDHGNRLDITVRLHVALSDRQAIFNMSVDNHSPYIVESAYCPYLGDVQHPAQAQSFKTFLYSYASAQEWSIWPTFQNMRGYYGVDYPTQVGEWSPALGAPAAPYILLRSAEQGLYMGVAAPSTELVAWLGELHPGYGSSIDSRVPATNTIAGEEVCTRFAAVHMPYIQPGEARQLTPIALEAYEGDWQHGVDIYKNWRNTWMKTPRLPRWASEPHAWQQIHINSPEDELRLRFTDLPKLGEECARHGVRAIQLVGWNDGGQDQGNPSHDPDSRLGTFEELKSAIASIQAMGVRVILFSKFTWADRATPSFRNNLIRLAIKDPYGDYQVHPGYQYQTPAQLLDINTKRLVPMCFLSEEYLHVCEDEFRKTLALGADGILFDECLHHIPTLLCFDQTHGHRYGAPTYANDRELIRRFEQISRLQNSEFLYAGEACYDWEMEAYHLSYHRSESKKHIPLSRYMLPHALLMAAVTGFDDRNMINQCLMYRYIISYEPYNFKGHLDDYPLTLSYGKQMDALRVELRDYFWDGEFCDKAGAQVICNERPHHPYAVYLNRQSGRPGLVICNYDETNSIEVNIKLDDAAVQLRRYRTVDDPLWHNVSEGITIPASSAVVVVE